MKFKAGQRVTLQRLTSTPRGTVTACVGPVDKVVSESDGLYLKFKGSGTQYSYRPSKEWGTVVQRLGGHGASRYYVVA